MFLLEVFFEGVYRRYMEIWGMDLNGYFCCLSKRKHQLRGPYGTCYECLKLCLTLDVLHCIADQSLILNICAAVESFISASDLHFFGCEM